MNLPILNFVRWYPITSLILAGALFSVCSVLYNYYKADDYIPVTLTGVHHLGSDYRIAEFYVDKYGGDNVGKSGYSGIVCCRMLPRKWSPGLKANVRWEVHHIVGSSDNEKPETEEITGIYHAQVPVEQYIEPDRIWVHFFPEGRVRIVVSPEGSDSEKHPIHPNDVQAIKRAATGRAVNALFTEQEISALRQETGSDRRNFGEGR